MNKQIILITAWSIKIYVILLYFLFIAFITTFQYTVMFIVYSLSLHMLAHFVLYHCISHSRRVSAQHTIPESMDKWICGVDWGWCDLGLTSIWCHGEFDHDWLIRNVMSVERGTHSVPQERIWLSLKISGRLPGGRGTSLESWRRGQSLLGEGVGVGHGPGNNRCKSFELQKSL